MVFVLEGHDLSGKTTAGVQLAADLALPLVTPWADLSAPKPSLTSISRTLLNVAMAVRQDLLLDRFITSELVYAPLAGRTCDYIHTLLSEWTAVMPVCVLQMWTSEEELRARFQERRDHLFELAEIIRIRQSYTQLEELLPRDVDFVRCESIADLRSAILLRRSSRHGSDMQA